MQALLQYTMAPTFIKVSSRVSEFVDSPAGLVLPHLSNKALATASLQFDGDFYGVYDVVGGPGDTEAGRAAKRLQLRANRAREAAQVEEAHREQRRLAEHTKREFLGQIARDTHAEAKPAAQAGATSWEAADLGARR